MISEEFINRRKAVFNKLKENEMAILFAGEAPRKSADETWPHTPNRNFYYLSGIAEQKDVIVMLKYHNLEQTILFINRYDEVKAKWVGATLLKDEATKISGIQSVMYLDEMNDLLGNFLPHMDSLLLDLERQGLQEAATPAQNFAGVIAIKYPFLKIVNLYDTLAALRMIKSPEEVAEIRQAIAITNKGFKALLQHAKASIGHKEHYLEAYFDCAIKQNGASDFAFETIAAGGKNACILHYRANDSLLNDKELVLFDMGAEYNYYKSDISRTFPLNGKFTARQKQIYQIVLEGQKVVMKHAKPGISCAQLNQELIKYFAQELKKIGLIRQDEECAKYYFHGCSHHIGLDTHDAQIMYAPLQEGCVISNEPGLYIAEEGLGIRIEDDLLITKNGCENLSVDIIKSVEDIEKFMK